MNIQSYLNLNFIFLYLLVLGIPTLPKKYLKLHLISFNLCNFTVTFFFFHSWYSSSNITITLCFWFWFLIQIHLLKMETVISTWWQRSTHFILKWVGAGKKKMFPTSWAVFSSDIFLQLWDFAFFYVQVTDNTMNLNKM